MLPYDISRCAGSNVTGGVHRLCQTCERRNSPGRPEHQSQIAPALLVIESAGKVWSECAKYISPGVDIDAAHSKQG
jgi:hypothetical protein